jgi:hypothetical protein
MKLSFQFDLPKELLLAEFRLNTDEVAHEKRTKDTDNFLVTVGA